MSFPQRMTDLSFFSGRSRHTRYISVTGVQTCALPLCKDNKSPFVKVSKGEYLHAMEGAITRYYEAEKKKISEREQGDQKRVSIAVKQLDEKIVRFSDGLNKNKQKYKDRLSEEARTSIQANLNDLDNGRD